MPTNVRPFQAELVGYDTQIQSRFLVVASATGANLLPHTRGGVLVWSNQSLPGSRNDYTWSISSASVRDVLPSARRNPLTTASPDVSYFGETGHNLAFGFKAIWERSGGLPVFGYPLTEEFAERNRDTGSRTNCQTRLSKP
ncbi:MAG TPA: hypothetical protein VLA19_09235 [Herpetosiphonaceae bacterium]|nr:hypothetical protein [Herpetosiphonaceae bacterium]